MLDYTVIEAIRSSVAAAFESFKNAGPKRGAICVEIKNFKRQFSLLPNYDGFTFSELYTFGAITEEWYCVTLHDHVHTGHKNILDNKPVPNLDIDGSPILVGQCTLEYEDELYYYSVAIGVTSCSREQNQAVLDLVMKDIEACQPK